MDADFEQLLCLLMDNQVQFLIVGGVACALNGYVRATDDVDILIESSTVNVDKLLAALGQWGEGHARELSLADFTLEPGAIRIMEEFPLDVFTLLSGKTYNDYIPRARTNPRGFAYLHPLDLIHAKKTSLREKDQLDIMALNRILAREAGV